VIHGDGGDGGSLVTDGTRSAAGKHQLDKLGKKRAKKKVAKKDDLENACINRITRPISVKRAKHLSV